MFLNRRVATHFWVAGTHFRVAKTCIIVVFNSVWVVKLFNLILWVANYEMLRTTDITNGMSRLNIFWWVSRKSIFTYAVYCVQFFPLPHPLESPLHVFPFIIWGLDLLLLLSRWNKRWFYDMVITPKNLFARMTKSRHKGGGIHVGNVRVAKNN